ncbi:cysteine hydrolase [Herbaspirillum sp. BH-1]|jgi:nicotinamidase-related amidase|uniref:Nicotinamidase-related amidase n=1 Tax=Herbaspirillum frisingense TaxID=92645 RepID=A0ABU1PER1_9BURK|nr:MULTISPECIES: cysteine hydrolase [Herbaspirillum]MDR6584249.1 nicotinamidase-related amidase [Herbaspirillum frisingense]PLY59476.1 cysteine hydrolase [Herbaspirillum sp. BH-1]UIN21325.1 cysteine hydrolase [Herbaspirillum frisingense]
MRTLPHRLCVALIGLSACVAALSPASAQGVYDDWSSVKAPAAPALSHITVDPSTTALLVLDLARQTCHPDTRPRCVAMLPRVAKMLALAREKKITVIHTLGGASTPADVWPEAAMQAGEPLFKSGPDKFLNTDLEKTLRDKGIKTVICIGAAAHGAVLHTASSAALRGFDVVVPVDLMASDTPYAEQYAAWHLVNAPRLGERVKLTQLSWIN